MRDDPSALAAVSQQRVRVTLLRDATQRVT